MKKLALILAILLIPAIGLAKIYKATPSGILNSDGAVYAGHGLITSIQVITNGTNDATAIIYDNPSAASGTIVAKFKVVGADHYGGAVYQHPKKCKLGIYLDIEGTGAEVIIDYVPGE